MSDCCSTNGNDASCSSVSTAEVKKTAVCPSCSQKGKKVDTQTVKAMLQVSLKAIHPTAEYRFCKTSDCHITYFTTDGEQVFTEAELRVPVHQKHPDVDDVPVCYCFHHSPGSIREAFQSNSRSQAISDITEGIQAEQCACDIRNPQGSCCLGNVRAVVKQIETEFISVTA